MGVWGNYIASHFASASHFTWALSAFYLAQWLQFQIWVFVNPELYSSLVEGQHFPPMTEREVSFLDGFITVDLRNPLFMGISSLPNSRVLVFMQQQCHISVGLTDPEEKYSSYFYWSISTTIISMVWPTFFALDCYDLLFSEKNISHFNRQFVFSEICAFFHYHGFPKLQ